MNKRYFSLIICIIMLLSFITVPAGAVSVYNKQKKSIYFVMDDSGSMGGTNEHDANYSLQSLVSMCDKDDSIRLYFLNSNFGNSKLLDMTKKDNIMIENVRKSYPVSNGGTPYKAVNTAKRELTDSASAGDNTEYWLVILTDGSFDSGSPNPASDLSSFAQTPLANGTYPNVLFVSIGGSVIMQSNGNLHYLSGTDIVSSMNEAAKLISSRVEVTPTYNSDSEITFKIPYPARNIVVFSQNNEIKITSYNSASKLDISENYKINYPISGGPIEKSTVCFVKEQNKSSITAGDVTLTFNAPLDRKNTVVLVEPAIGLTAHFYNQDGQEIDPGKLQVGETAKVKYSLCDSETNDPIDDSAFAGNVKYTSKINGTNYNSNEFEFEVTSDTLNIELYAQLPDGYIFGTHNSYDNLLTKRDIIFTLSNGGTFKSDYSDLKKAEGIRANILLNGKQPTAEQMEDFSLKIRGKNYLVSNFSVEKDKDNGCFIIKPTPGIISPLTPLQKNYEVILTDKNGSTYTANLNVEIPGARNWLPFLLWLLGLYVVFCILSKKYFRWTATFTVWDNRLPQKDDSSYYERRSIWKLYLYEIGALFSFRSIDALLHFLDFFFVPCGCQKVTLFNIAECNFERITLHADKSGELRVHDHTLHQDKNGKCVSDYSIVLSNRRALIDFNKRVSNKALIPFSDGESLKIRVSKVSWYIIYKK